MRSTVLIPSPTRDERRHCRSFVLVAHPVAPDVVDVVLRGLVVVLLVVGGFVLIVVVVVAVCLSALVCWM